MTTEADFLAFVAALFNVPAGTLSLDTAYAAIPQWDSVMHIRLVMELEERYSISIPLDEIASVRTLRDAFAYLNR